MVSGLCFFPVPFTTKFDVGINVLRDVFDDVLECFCMMKELGRLQLTERLKSINLCPWNLEWSGKMKWKKTMERRESGKIRARIFRMISMLLNHQSHHFSLFKFNCIFLWDLFCNIRRVAREGRGVVLGYKSPPHSTSWKISLWKTSNY